MKFGRLSRSVSSEQWGPGQGRIQDCSFGGRGSTMYVRAAHMHELKARSPLHAYCQAGINNNNKDGLFFLGGGGCFAPPRPLQWSVIANILGLKCECETWGLKSISKMVCCIMLRLNWSLQRKEESEARHMTGCQLTFFIFFFKSETHNII